MVKGSKTTNLLPSVYLVSSGYENISGVQGYCCCWKTRPSIVMKAKSALVRGSPYVELIQKSSYTTMATF